MLLKETGSKAGNTQKPGRVRGQRSCDGNGEEELGLEHTHLAAPTPAFGILPGPRASYGSGSVSPINSLVCVTLAPQ